MVNTALHIIILCLTTFYSYASDVVLIGPVHKGRSISTHVTSFMNCLDGKVGLSIAPSSWSDYKEFSENFLSKIISPNEVINLNAPIILFVDRLEDNYLRNYLRTKYSGLRIIFAWTDDALINKSMVNDLNACFDMVIVPDKCIVEAFKKSGVTTPIYTLPLSLELEPFLSMKRKREQKSEFVFGCNAALNTRKNYPLLLQAFAEEFGDTPLVKLKLHGRFGPNADQIRRLVRQYNLSNVEFSEGIISTGECLDFYKALDCYILVSRGEGFSITPREALATGIPCILSNNTAHKTICQTGFVYAVPSQSEGIRSNCLCQDVRKALREVYANYNKYYGLAQKGREWTMQYLAKNLSEKYAAIVCQADVVFGKNNVVNATRLETNSSVLFKKLQFAQSKIKTAKKGK